MTTIVLWSTAWALALIASAILLKGNPAKEWVQAALFIGALTVSLWQSTDSPADANHPPIRFA